MKKVLLTVLQFIVFLLIFATGSFLPPFHIERVLGVTRDGTRIFIWDGILLMAALFLVILLIEAVSRRARSGALWTTLAFILAAAAGYAAKLGFLTRPQ